MPEYLSPGVYVEEVDAGPKPIEGVSTSTAGALGVTLRGPTSGKPVLVTSYADFVRRFGGVMRPPDAGVRNQWNLTADGGQWWKFALSVRGFFDNGGQRLFVKRVFSAQAKAAKAQIGQGLVLKLRKDAPTGTTASPSTSIVLESLIGISRGQDVTLVRADSGLEDGPYAVDSYDAATGTVRLAQSITAGAPVFGTGVKRDLSQGRDYARLAALATTATVTFEARDKGIWAGATTPPSRGLYVYTRPVIGNTLNLLNAPGQGPVVSVPSKKDAIAGSTSIEIDAAQLGQFNTDNQVVIDAVTYTVASTNAGTSSVVLTTGLKADAPLGTSITRLREATPSVVSTTITAVDPLTSVLTLASATGISAGSTLLIGGNLYTSSAPNAASEITLTPTPAPLPAVGAAVEVRPETIEVWGGRSLYEGAIVELDNGTHKERRRVSAIQGNSVALAAIGGAAGLQYHYWERQKLYVIEAEVLVEYREFDEVVEAEAFTSLRLVDDGTPSYLVNHINLASKLVTATREAGYSETDLARFPTAPHGGWFAFTGGDDALPDLDIDAFVGTDGGSGNRTGIAALEDIDEISICLAPNIWATGVHAALIQHCETLRDRFAILDPRDSRSLQEIQDDRAPIDTKYAALYYPWLRVRDPLAKTNVVLAPSGHIAGVYARVDNERGFHKAPANEVVRGIDLREGFAQDITKREQDLLNPKGINALRFFPGRGHRVWGARTLSSDSSWKYVNVRRIFIMIEESIDEGTQWVVFEPNDRPLWSRVRQTIINFLTTQWRNGVLQGKSAEEAFFVRCDESTMTQDDIDNGRLICVIGIAPVKPAEFVIFRIQQKTIDLQG
jgi:hypothetical protein